MKHTAGTGLQRFKNKRYQRRDLNDNVSSRFPRRRDSHSGSQMKCTRQKQLYCIRARCAAPRARAWSPPRSHGGYPLRRVRNPIRSPRSFFVRPSHASRNRHANRLFFPQRPSFMHARGKLEAATARCLHCKGWHARFIFFFFF